MKMAPQKSSGSDESVRSICKFPFCQSTEPSSSSSHSNTFHHNHNPNPNPNQSQGQRSAAVAAANSSASVSSVANSLLPTRRKLVLDPPTKLYFPYDPGKQARSAI